jgi:hypothetical protein
VVVEQYEGKYLGSLWGKERTVPTTGRDRTFAVLGGWRIFRTDDVVRGDLVLTALASTEPLIDVWRVGADFEVLSHVT